MAGMLIDEVVRRNRRASREVGSASRLLLLPTLGARATHLVWASARRRPARQRARNGGVVTVRMRMMAPLVLLVAAVTVAVPDSTAAQDAPCTISPYAHDHTNGSTPSEVPVPGTLRGWRDVGAEVQLIGSNAVALGDLVFTVLLAGEQRTFTTSPYPTGGHYTQRAPRPENTGWGNVWLSTDAPDGQLYVRLVRGSSGTSDSYAWRWDDPCGPASLGPDIAGSTPLFTG
jgi:hypothetical protein